MRHPDLDALFQRRRAVTTVARALGISKTAVSKWPVVPPARVSDVARALGVHPSTLPTRKAKHDRDADSAGVAVDAG